MAIIRMAFRNRSDNGSHSIYCHTIGLKYIEASRAAILATIEPLVATLLGILIYHEMITVGTGVGIFCILSAVVILNFKPFSKR